MYQPLSATTFSRSSSCSRFLGRRAWSNTLVHYTWLCQACVCCGSVNEWRKSKPGLAGWQPLAPLTVEIIWPGGRRSALLWQRLRPPLRSCGRCSCPSDALPQFASFFPPACVIPSFLPPGAIAAAPPLQTSSLASLLARTHPPLSLVVSTAVLPQQLSGNSLPRENGPVGFRRQPAQELGAKTPA